MALTGLSIHAILHRPLDPDPALEHDVDTDRAPPGRIADEFYDLDVGLAFGGDHDEVARHFGLAGDPEPSLFIAGSP